MSRKARPKRLCVVAGCEMVGVVKGVCNMHRARMRRTGSYDTPKPFDFAAHRARVEAQKAARAAAKLAPTQPPASPEAALYRAEKDAARERRTIREAQLIAEAKASYARLLADLERKGKGGRPRKAMSPLNTRNAKAS